MSNRQTWVTTLFSFRGRIGRGRFLAAMLLITIDSAIVAVVASAVAHGIVPGGENDTIELSAGAFLAGFIALLLVVLYAWSTLAIMVKRWHDRDRSGWWATIVLIPGAGLVWALIDHLSVAGTQGQNLSLIHI